MTLNPTSASMVVACLRALARRFGFNAALPQLRGAVNRVRIAADDRKLHRHLHAFARRNGSLNLVQIGAHDGIADDHIRPLVARYRWTGVLVEPLPEIFERLQCTYAGIPGISFENAAIAEFTGEINFYRVRPGAQARLAPWAQGVASLNRQHVVREVGDNEIVAELAVPSLTLPALLDKHGLERLDVLAVDAEGADFMILKQIQLLHCRPKLILYEYKHMSVDERRACAAMLEGQGYRLRDFWVDTLAVLRH